MSARSHRRLRRHLRRVDEALRPSSIPGVRPSQIIFNPFRQRPTHFFAEAARRGVRDHPSASRWRPGSVGQIHAETTFGPDDHRPFTPRRAFHVGDTFAGVPFDVGSTRWEDPAPLVPEGATLAQLALRWILMHDAVSTVIPGAGPPSRAATPGERSAALGYDAIALIATVYAGDRTLRAARW